MKSFIRTIEDAVYVADKMLECSDEVEMSDKAIKRLEEIVEITSEKISDKDLKNCQSIFNRFFSIEDGGDIRRSIIDSNRKHRQTRPGVDSKQKKTKQIRVSLKAYNSLNKIVKSEGLGSIGEAVGYLIDKAKE